MGGNKNITDTTKILFLPFTYLAQNNGRNSQMDSLIFSNGILFITWFGILITLVIAYSCVVQKTITEARMKQRKRKMFPRKIVKSLSITIPNDNIAILKMKVQNSNCNNTSTPIR